MEEMTTGLCPKCGHALQIPVELEQFSCMYCGERLSRQQLLTEPGAEVQPLPEERVIFNEKQEAIRNAMNALPVDFREILELRVVRQLPYEQIAQIMDLPVGTVKSRLARARLQLKKRLDAGNFFETGTSKHSE